MTPTSHNSTRIALFAGSFDPFTKGHASIVERILPLFDKLVIAIGINANKPCSTNIDERIRAISKLYADDRIEVISYSNELTVDLASRIGAKWLIRGVRSVKDFEYERDIADINRKLSGIETLLLYSLPEYSGISSSIVRELQSYGHDVSDFLP